MIKKIITSFFVIFALIFTSVDVFSAPSVNCIGLPGCKDVEIKEPEPATEISNNIVGDFVGGAIEQLIMYVGVIAVIALMLSGIMYLVSGGEEEKVQRAKRWIIWSLVGVLISGLAYSIIGFVNRLSI